MVPSKRNYVLKFNDIVSADITVTVDGKKAAAAIKKCGKTLEVTVTAKPDSTVEVEMENCTYLQNENKKVALTNYFKIPDVN